MHKRGYRYIKIKYHPFANKDGYVPEHRLVMENYLRENDPKNKNLIKVNQILYLNPIAVVHHIDRDKLNNQIKNLKVFENVNNHTAFHNKSNTDTVRKKRKGIKHPHPMTSLGKKKMSLLMYMQKIKDERFNVKAYSRTTEIPRASVYYMLDCLTKLELINKVNLGNFKINEKGINYIDMILYNETTMSDKSRSICHEDDIKSGNNLSSHYQKYTSIIVDKNKFMESNLNRLNCLKWKRLDLKNLTQYYIYFDDVTIIINPKMVIIRIKDLLTNNTEKSQFESFNKVLKYVTVLDGIGVILDNIVLEAGHYARVKSIFADILKELDKRYYIDLEDGKRFWIDYSTGEGEDETNDILVREKIDNLLKDVSISDSKFSDIDKIKDVLSMITKLELNRTISKVDEKIMPKGQGKLPSYFG